MRQREGFIPITPRTQRHEALEVIGETVNAAGRLMAARGDLGIRTPLEKILMIPKPLLLTGSLLVRQEHIIFSFNR